MAFKYTGKIKFSDNSKINFEINADGQVQYSFTDGMPFEPIEFLQLMSEAIRANYNLLKGCSPKHIEMDEVEV